MVNKEGSSFGVKASAITLSTALGAAALVAPLVIGHTSAQAEDVANPCAPVADKPADAGNATADGQGGNEAKHHTEFDGEIDYKALKSTKLDLNPCDNKPAIDLPADEIKKLSPKAVDIIGKQLQLVPGAYQSVYSARNNEIYISASEGNQAETDRGVIYKIDADTLQIKAKVRTPIDPTDKDGAAGFAPFGIGYSEKNDEIWVTNTLVNTGDEDIDGKDGTIAVYKASDLSLVKQFPRPTYKDGNLPADKQFINHAHEVVVDDAHNRAYVSADRGNVLYVFDATTHEALTDQNIVFNQREAWGTADKDWTKPHLDKFGPAALVLEPQNNKLYVGSVRAVNDIAVIDTTTGKFEKFIEVPNDVTWVIDIAHDPKSGNFYVVSLGHRNGDDWHSKFEPKLTIIDKDGNVLKSIKPTLEEQNIAPESQNAGAASVSVTVDSVNDLLYVAQRNLGTFAIYDLQGNLLETIKSGDVAHPNHLFTDGKGNVFAVSNEFTDDILNKPSLLQKFSVKNPKKHEGQQPAPEQHDDAAKQDATKGDGAQGGSKNDGSKDGSVVAGSNNGGLANTGADFGGLVAGAVAVALAGGVLVARRRKA